MPILKPAPPLAISAWLNSTQPISLAQLRGKVVLLEAFQMLCPGCVSHALPQAVRVRQTFSAEEVAVIGLHSVFEHHQAQGSVNALEAFLHEYRITFPIGVDARSKAGGLPQTMSAYQMQGTPTTILIDKGGYIRKHKFGAEQDMILGAEIMSLLREPDGPIIDADAKRRHTAAPDNLNANDEGCTETGCVAPSR